MHCWVLVKALAFPRCTLTPPLWGGEDGSLCFTNNLCEGVYRSFPSCLLGVGKSYPTAFCSSRLPLSWLSGWRKRVFLGAFIFWSDLYVFRLWASSGDNPGWRQKENPVNSLPCHSSVTKSLAGLPSSLQYSLKYIYIFSFIIFLHNFHEECWGVWLFCLVEDLK